MDNTITVVGKEQGQSLSIAGGAYRILISGEQTNDNYAVIEMLVPPGAGPGPHAHKDIQEMFYVVEGEVEFKMEAGKQVAGKGSFINIPLGGAVHGFKNKTDTTVHLLCTVVPAGLDRFFQEIGTPVEPGTFKAPTPLTPEALDKLKAIGERYGQQFYPPDFLD
jgi:quercetin dioxygenase-like cupin family protein